MALQSYKRDQDFPCRYGNPIANSPNCWRRPSIPAGPSAWLRIELSRPQNLSAIPMCQPRLGEAWNFLAVPEALPEGFSMPRHCSSDLDTSGQVRCNPPYSLEPALWPL